MKTALIIHGMSTKEEYFSSDGDSPSNRHWLPWLQKELLLKGVLAQTPEMPEPYEPNYERWKAIFERFPIDENSILIGHSCGAGFLVRWLSEHQVKVRQVFLVAPWIDIEKELKNGFFDFSVDTDLVQKTVHGAVMMYSIDDDDYILQSVQALKTIKGIIVREFTNKGHFVVDDMKTIEFPELLNEVVK